MTSFLRQPLGVTWHLETILTKLEKRCMCVGVFVLNMCRSVCVRVCVSVHLCAFEDWDSQHNLNGSLTAVAHNDFTALRWAVQLCNLPLIATHLIMIVYVCVLRIRPKSHPPFSSQATGTHRLVTILIIHCSWKHYTDSAGIKISLWQEAVNQPCMGLCMCARICLCACIVPMVTPLYYWQLMLN